MPYRESTMSWLSARAACKELDPSADLASSTSVSENSFLSSLDDSSTCTNFMWLGGTNAHTEEGEWTWSDGSPFIFENWQSGEGDDGPLEDCLGLYTGTCGDLGTWHDDPCYKHKWFICEKIIGTLLKLRSLKLFLKIVTM